MLHHARGLGALFDYAIQVEGLWREWGRRETHDDVRQALLRNYALSTLNGTIQPNGIDATGLYWHPKSYQAAKSQLDAVERFLTWDSVHGGGKNWWGESDELDRLDSLSQVRQAYRADIKHNVSLLSHLPRRKKARKRRLAAGYPTLSRGEGGTSRFPVKFVWPMLFEGFRLKSGEVDETPKAIAHLILMGGLRKSEPLNLWVHDVGFSSNKVSVSLHHPRDAMVVAPDGTRMTRIEVLKKFFRSDGRPYRSDRLFAGWKGVKGDMTNAVVHWLPIEGVEDHVHAVLFRYVHQVRPAIMSLRRHNGLPDHPFLFVNPGRAGSEIGAPYSAAALTAAWERAVARLCRNFDEPQLKYGKRYGTTPHGGRHFYGHYLRRLYPGNIELVQHCMHHLSPFSQLAYTQPTPDEIHEMMDAGGGSVPPEFRSLSDALRAQRNKGGNWR
jgi:integrase